MSNGDWHNPAWDSLRLHPGFTVISWCSEDDKNTCKICPCLFDGTPSRYYKDQQPCGSPLIAIATDAAGIKTKTTGTYYEQVGPEHAGDPTVPITSAPFPVQPMPVSIQFFYQDGTSDTFGWFGLGPGTDHISFSGVKEVYFVVGPPSYPTNQATIFRTTWTSWDHIPVGDWLQLADTDSKYPNGTYDMIYKDGSGDYDRYLPWTGPVPPENTQVYLNTQSGHYQESSNVTYGLPWTTNSVDTVIDPSGSTPSLAAYGRDSVSYSHEDAGISPYSPQSTHVHRQSQSMANRLRGI